MKSVISLESKGLEDQSTAPALLTIGAGVHGVLGACLVSPAISRISMKVFTQKLPVIPIAGMTIGNNFVFKQAFLAALRFVVLNSRYPPQSVKSMMTSSIELRSDARHRPYVIARTVPAANLSNKVAVALLINS